MALFGKGKSDDPLVLMQQGQFKEAVKLLQAKLRRAPHDFPLKMRLAEALEGWGKKDEACRIYVDEGEAVLQGGDRAKGLALLKKAARLFPEDAALKEKISHLEGRGQQGGDDAFSFDVDVAGEAPPEAAPEPAGAPAEEPPAASGEAAEPEAGLLDFEMEAPSAEAPAASAGAEEEAPPRAVEEEAEVDEGVRAADPEEPEISETSARPFLTMGDHVPNIRALFPELNEEEAVLLDLVATPVYLGAGDVLVREQEEGDSLFIVSQGRLEARGRFESGVVSLAVLSAGDLVGEVAFLKKVPRTATVTALEPSLVLELPAEETRTRLAAHPEAMANLEKILQARVERTLALVKEQLRQGHGD